MRSSRRTEPDQTGAGRAPSNPAARDWDFLPDFCSSASTLAVVLIAELIALVLTLVQSEWVGNFWIGWGWISLYLQWMALSGAAILCFLRRLAPPLPPALALALVYGLLLAAAILIGLGVEAVWPLANQPLEGFLWRSTLAAAIIDALVLRYFYVLGAWKSDVRAEAEVRLEALESRLRPHFLFNTLNTILVLIRRDAARAETALLNLADLFRSALETGSSRSTLGQELDWARQYLALEEVRLGSKLDVVWEIDTLPRDAMVPRLLLQPIVENAVYHGIENTLAGGRIEIRGRRLDSRIELTITNPNPYPAEGTVAPRHGLALDILKRRLALVFPERLELLRTEDRDGHFTLRLTLPYEPWKPEASRDGAR
ncbi:two-component system sensor protein [mine drainage metagenome]|uniref:Two-component system sensor protein n=1 Tax=mine drainage metagenome TaxID=410659 RepID=T1BSA8_9ZZZZ